MTDYSHHFQVWGRDVSGHATDCLSGLPGTERRTYIECIHGDIPESNCQGIQHRISDSRWEATDVMDQIAREVNGLLGGHRHSAPIIDETRFVKRGDRSERRT
ncbi:MAG: transposase [Verrucomicrobiae bacterium]|nr:transposase [Verrucomicrobiae bacterium]